MSEYKQKEDLEKTVDHLEEEARMVLPGIQALFGFQLIAVFNNRFEDLSDGAQLLHFIALLCTAVAILLVLTPAAYHRQAERDSVSRYFVNMGSRLLTLSLFPLALGTSLDIFVIGTLIFDSVSLNFIFAGILFCLFVGAWFLFPRLRSSTK
jgi:hypothetical protein